MLPNETAAPTTPPRLKMDQNIPMKMPFWSSVGYASIRDPCAVQRRPALTPRYAPAARTNGPVLGWILYALGSSQASVSGGRGSG